MICTGICTGVRSRGMQPCRREEEEPGTQCRVPHTRQAIYHAQTCTRTRMHACIHAVLHILGRALASQAEHSWGYSSTGKKSTGKSFLPYYETFGPGDEITCMVDLTADPPMVTFAKNGTIIGKAFNLPRARNASQAYFPHVLIKNMEVELDFKGAPPKGHVSYTSNSAWSDVWQGYPPWEQACSSKGKGRPVSVPASGVQFKACEVLTMVGLPGKPYPHNQTCLALSCSSLLSPPPFGGFKFFAPLTSRQLYIFLPCVRLLPLQALARLAGL